MDNLELRCRAHNAFEAELFFGPWIAREYRASYRMELGPDRVGATKLKGATSYMPPVPFRYYMLAFKTWVLLALERAHVTDASDAASSFLRLIESRLEQDRASIEPIMPQLLPAVDFVEMNQERYGAGRDIYGDFRQVAERIRTRWAVPPGNVPRT